ncbi:hypothetical protein NMD98_11095, partial [Enterococcus faecium]|nr:hypothetical protein [Enterococcus faecium]
NLFDQSINQCKITKNLSQNVVHSDSDLILHNSSVLIDKEPKNRGRNWIQSHPQLIFAVSFYKY